MKIFISSLFLGFIFSYALFANGSPVDPEEAKETLYREATEAIALIDQKRFPEAQVKLPTIYDALKVVREEHQPAFRVKQQGDYSNKQYCKGCECPSCNCWDFSPGNTYVDKIWEHQGCGNGSYQGNSCSCEPCCCSSKCTHGNAGCFGSLICAGFIPCHILQFFIEPCRCSNYEGGSCCRVGCPLEAKVDWVQVRNFLSDIQKWRVIRPKQLPVDGPMGGNSNAK